MRGQMILPCEIQIPIKDLEREIKRASQQKDVHDAVPYRRLIKIPHLYAEGIEKLHNLLFISGI